MSAVNRYLLFLFLVKITVSLSKEKCTKETTMDTVCDNGKNSRKGDLFRVIDECYNSGDRSNCTWSEITRYQPLNLLINIMRAFKNVSTSDHQRFKAAMSKLMNRINHCNPMIYDNLVNSIQCMNLFKEGKCAHKWQVCKQNHDFMYPIYCTAQKHLAEIDADLNYTQILQLYYGIGYAFQMVNSESNTVLRCDSTKHDVLTKYLKENTTIESDLIQTESICKYYIDFYYNLYADKDDSRFLNCHENKNSNAKIDEHVDKFLSLRSTNDLTQFMRIF